MESSAGQKSQFCNLLLEVTSHHFCHVLLVRSELPSPHSKGGKYTGHEDQEARTIRACLDAAYCWNPAAIWGKSIPGRGNSMCKGPEAGASLACGQNNVTGAGTEERGAVEHEEGRGASSQS